MIMPSKRTLVCWGTGVFFFFVLAARAGVSAETLAGAPPLGPSAPDVGGLGLAGGLCVEVGCGDVAGAARLAKTGRFLIQSLDRDPTNVARKRQEIAAQSLYGLVSVERLESSDRLPYAENLVNLLVLGDGPTAKVPLAEAFRVVCPGGFVAAAGVRADEAALKAAGFEAVTSLGNGGGWRAARRPWPSGMDAWTHPWHAADGNTVSRDTFVGPPRRVRWVTGPSIEISSMVSAAGRNFYGGLWARDAFNGLPLWERELKPSPAQGGFGFGLAAGSVRPVAVGENVLAVIGDVVWLLDGASGRQLRSYPEAGRPASLLHVGGTILSVGPQWLRAVEVESGRLRWQAPVAAPRYVVATDKAAFGITGNAKAGEKVTAVAFDMATGARRWQKDAEPWLPLVRRIVAHGDRAIFEVSTVNDTKEGNAIHVVSAADGSLLWSRSFVPGMNHMKQARAMFIGDDLWVLEHLKCVQLDPQTGTVKQTHPAGLCHCFPPVATTRYMFSGEMELTDLSTGQMDANRITKANCSRDAGWVPANGLIYLTPKHCVCWPMLRGYVGLAPALPTDEAREVVEKRRFTVERGSAPPPASSAAASAADWPCYRHDPWRSGATAVPIPDELQTLWTANLGAVPEAPITKDWRENPFVRGPITAPVAAGGRVYVARPDGHEVVALDMATGSVGWRFTADGRVDTPPTIDRGLCLFGSKSGSVYALRADDGRMVWRLRAAPTDQQIVAYGQLESPWPVPGSVLVIDDTLYFAAGRHPLADGGVLLFAVEPTTGAVRWVQRLDRLPMTNFYACIGLEFDNFDLLHQEGEAVAMSRWLFDRRTGQMVVNPADAFVRVKTGDTNVVVQRGVWTYAPRNQPRFDAATERAPRPLAVFRGSTLLGCAQDQRSVYRRDFDTTTVEKFDAKWITGWAASENARKQTGDVWPVGRLQKDAQWSAPVLRNAPPGQRIAALTLAADRLVVVGSTGGLQALGLEDGRVVATTEVPAPIWDGLAVASERLLLSTMDGRVLCLGRK